MTDKPIQDDNTAPENNIETGLNKEIEDSILSDPIFNEHSSLRPDNRQLFNTIQGVLKLCILVVLSIILIALLYPYIKNRVDAVSKAISASLPRKSQQINDNQLNIANNSQNSSNLFKENTNAPLITVKTGDQNGETTLPLTISLAENLFFHENYTQAYTAYSTLYTNVPDGPQNDIITGFLRLRMGQCKQFSKKNGIVPTQNITDAEQLFIAATASKSPVVKVLSYYFLSDNYLIQGKYLKARSAAYRAYAAAEIPDDTINWISQLKQNCQYMAAEAVTRHTLALYDADDYDSEKVWKKQQEISDPFLELNETQISIFLTSGSERMRQSISSPVITKVNGTESVQHYKAVCYDIYAEELIARMAQNSNIEVVNDAGMGTSNDNQRLSPITMYMPDATIDELISTAAGCAGLLADVDESKATITDLGYYSNLNEYLLVLSDEAASLWRKLFFTNSDDYSPGAHFALAILNSKNNKTDDAISEYKLIINRFTNNSLAPMALLNSAKIKSEIFDNIGARADLQYLVEQYPESEVTHEGLLYLADLTMQAQSYEDACRLYNKVYYFSNDTEIQAKASLGAGRSYLEVKNYELAAGWLAKYMEHAKVLGDPDRYSTCYVLGKIYLNLKNYELAYSCLWYSLKGSLKKAEQLDAIESLVNAYIANDDYIRALSILESDEVSFSSSQNASEILLLKSTLLRTMGIVDGAIRNLKVKVDRIIDNEIKAKTLLELGFCYKAKGDNKNARESFLKAFSLAEESDLSNQIALQIADTCIELNEYEQAVSMCEHILETSSNTSQIEKARELMGSAYLYSKDYNKALASLVNVNNG